MTSLPKVTVLAKRRPVTVLAKRRPVTVRAKRRAAIVAGDLDGRVAKALAQFRKWLPRINFEEKAHQIQDLKLNL